MRVLFKFCLWIILLLGFTGNIFADTNDESSSSIADYESLFDDVESVDGSDNESEESSNGTGLDFNLKLSGNHSCLFYLPVVEDYFNFALNTTPVFKNELGIMSEFKDISFESNWLISIINDNEQAFLTRTEVTPLENFIAWKSPWNMMVSAGYQIFSWGTGDGINPTDNLNPQDLSRGLDAEKIPILSFLLKFYPVDSFIWEFVYIPYDTPTIFKENPETALSNELTVLFPGATCSTREPDFDPSSFVVGTKLNLYQRFFDLSLSYIYDFDAFYSPDVKLVFNTIYQIESVELIRRRVHHFGLDFKTNIDIFSIWSEICYTLTDDYALDDYSIRNHKLSCVTGFDFTYGKNNNYFNFQIAGEYIPDYDDKFYDDYPDGLPTNPFDENAMSEYVYRAITNQLGGYYEGLLLGALINSEWFLASNMFRICLNGGVFLPFQYENIDATNDRLVAFIASPEIDFMPQDSFHIILGARLVYSLKKIDGDIEIDKSGRFGPMYSENAIYLNFNYKWDYRLEK